MMAAVARVKGRRTLSRPQAGRSGPNGRGIRVPPASSSRDLLPSLYHTAAGRLSLAVFSRSSSPRALRPSPSIQPQSLRARHAWYRLPRLRRLSVLFSSLPFLFSLFSFSFSRSPCVCPFRIGGSAGMAGRGPEVVPCPLEERPQALGVLYQRVPGALKPRLIADAMAEAASGLIDLSGLWIARRRGRVVGALLTQTLAGKAAAVWAPEVDTVFSRDAIAVALVRAALDELKRRGFLLAQALLDESTPRRGSADLARGGLPHITDLVYLEGDTQRDITVKPHLPSFDWRPFRPDTEAEFRAVLQATYIGSLDMPELEGIRSLDDILASHRGCRTLRPRTLAARPSPRRTRRRRGPVARQHARPRRLGSRLSWPDSRRTRPRPGTRGALSRSGAGAPVRPSDRAGRRCPQPACPPPLHPRRLPSVRSESRSFSALSLNCVLLTTKLGSFGETSPRTEAGKCVN